MSVFSDLIGPAGFNNLGPPMYSRLGLAKRKVPADCEGYDSRVSFIHIRIDYLPTVNQNLTTPSSRYETVTLDIEQDGKREGSPSVQVI